MKKLSLLAILGAAVMIPSANAAICASTTDCTFNFDSTDVSAFGAGPYGTINLHLSGSFINITVDLIDNFHIIDTGAHFAVSFNNTFADPTVTISNFNPATGYAQGGAGSNSPFGAFEDTVTSTCTNGGGCGANVLSFQVARTGGFTDVNQLVELSTGGGTNAYFAVDAACSPTTACPANADGGNTGVIGVTGNPTSSVPEPISLSLVGGGLLALGLFRKRFVA